MKGNKKMTNENRGLAIIANILATAGIVFIFLAALLDSWFGYIGATLGFLAVLCSQGKYALTFGISEISIGMIYALMGSLRVVTR